MIQNAQFVKYVADDMSPRFFCPACGEQISSDTGYAENFCDHVVFLYSMQSGFDYLRSDVSNQFLCLEHYEQSEVAAICPERTVVLEMTWSHPAEDESIIGIQFPPERPEDS